MEIIFAKLPKYLDSVSRVFRKFGNRVFYLELSQSLRDTKEIENRRVSKLKEAGIVPLPLENLSHFTGFSKIYYDPEKKVLKRTQQIAPKPLLIAFEQLFPNTKNITDKLQIIVHSVVANQVMDVTGKVNIWADANQDRNYLLIDVNPQGFLSSELAGNVRLFVVPLETIAKWLDKVINFFYRFLHLPITVFTFKSKSRSSTETHPREIPQTRVAFVTHKGLDYGNLYQKDLFYSDRIDSELHPERMLHIDYSDWANPSEKLKWVSLGNHRQSWISNISFAFIAVSKGILHIRRVRHILGLLILTRSYVIFRSFSKKLETYPDLKIALIDFEVLCPKELLLAFESKGIKTVAVQERFILSFNNLFGTILSYYLCDSGFAAENMKRSPIHSVDCYIPVGQYRSDNLLEAKKTSPPQILEVPLAKGFRIITALGFLTAMEWQNSQSDLIVNWTAHRHFLEDMIRLSKDIPMVFIILRYKGVDWISLPAFADLVKEINSSENITISLDYSKFSYSYDLCAHSDLVIAKHTSLADECLSIGIPVLFHEYTHNTERTIADAFDYSPAGILCTNYQELFERTKTILCNTPNVMTKDYEYLKNVIYGGLGDGKVRERIRTHIEKILSEL